VRINYRESKPAYLAKLVKREAKFLASWLVAISVRAADWRELQEQQEHTGGRISCLWRSWIELRKFSTVRSLARQGSPSRNKTRGSMFWR